MTASDAATAINNSLATHKLPLAVQHHVMALRGEYVDVFKVIGTEPGVMPDFTTLFHVSLALGALGFPPAPAGTSRRLVIPPNIRVSIYENTVTASVSPNEAGVLPTMQVLKSMHATLRQNLPGVKILVRLEPVLLD